ncbi:MAG: thioredoxin family protein [Deltaproteobacteria bacterium]|jgi:thiol:disulfide interchange protein DsbD|nr:thioredoxin family protein [Deltaproteobacteria bacterium]
MKKRHQILPFIRLAFILVASIVMAPYGLSASTPSSSEVIRVKSAWSQDRARPGDTIALAVVLDIQKGFHINADARQLKPMADFKPFPTRVRVVEAHQGLTIETPRYPQAHPIKVDYASKDLMSFEGKTAVLLPMQFTDSLQPGSAKVKLMVEYQACSATYCLFPQKVPLEETIAVVERSASVASINQAIFANFRSNASAVTSQAVDFDLFGWTFSIDVRSGIGWLLLVITAAFGGLLLNFTPCVLPLIPIKIISLSHAAQNRKRCIALGVAMFAGVIFFWLVLGVLITVVSDFTATNQLFQYPLFTIVVGIVIGTMALGMFGFFAVRLPNFIYMINPEQDSLYGSFGLGILAAILATPCTAPFMGAAAAWAATQTPATTLLTFSAIGFGMALPYLILSASPRLVEKMPKTGPGSVLIKQVMGLFMLAAAAYFIGVGLSAVFSIPPNPTSKFYWWPVMGFIAAGGIWLAYRTLRIAQKSGPRIIFTTVGIILIGLSSLGAISLTDKGPIDWVYYTPERYEALLEQNKVVVMVFTAEWCLNCKVLEEGVLRSPEIIKLFQSGKAVAVKVDITGKNPAGKAKLKEVGNLTIPLLVIFSPEGNHVFKSDFYTVEQVLKAVNRAIEMTSTAS